MEKYLSLSVSEFIKGVYQKKMLIHLCQASYPLSRQVSPWRQILNFQAIQTLIRKSSKVCFPSTTFFFFFFFQLIETSKEKKYFWESGNRGQRQIIENLGFSQLYLYIPHKAEQHCLVVKAIADNFHPKDDVQHPIPTRSNNLLLKFLQHTLSTPELSLCTTVLSLLQLWAQQAQQGIKGSLHTGKPLAGMPRPPLSAWCP